MPPSHPHRPVLTAALAGRRHAPTAHAAASAPAELAGVARTMDWTGARVARACRCACTCPTAPRRRAGAAGGVLARHRRLAHGLQLPRPLLGQPGLRQPAPAARGQRPQPVGRQPVRAGRGCATPRRTARPSRACSTCSFALDQLLAGALASRIDADRIVAAGPFLRRQHHAAGRRRAGRARRAAAGLPRPAHQGGDHPVGAALLRRDRPVEDPGRRHRAHAARDRHRRHHPHPRLLLAAPTTAWRCSTPPAARARRWRCSTAARTACSPTAAAPAAWTLNPQVKEATRALSLAFLKDVFDGEDAALPSMAGAVRRHRGALHPEQPMSLEYIEMHSGDASAPA